MRVLIIESDVAFAANLRLALEARGVEVAITADGEEGLVLAHAKPTTAVVLSVELGDRLIGGFTWCNKFKRDAALRAVPLILTSSLATNETFEQHRKLKTRADDYLLKPFGPEDLLEKLGPYLPIPPAPPADDATIDLAGELLAALATDGGQPEAPASLDEVDVFDADEHLDLDDALDDPHPDPHQGPGLLGTSDVGDLQSAAIASGAVATELDPGPAGFDLTPVGAELEALAAPSERPPQPPAGHEPRQSPRVFDTPWSDDEARKLPDSEGSSLRGRVAELERQLAITRAEASRMSELQARAGHLAEENTRLGSELSAAAGEASALRDRVAAMESELSAARTEIATMSQRASELEAETARHEARVVGAYRKLEAEERLRERMREALAAATQLLDASPAEHG